DGHSWPRNRAERCGTALQAPRRPDKLHTAAGCASSANGNLWRRARPRPCLWMVFYTGLTSIFVGAFWPVIAMGVALELGKLCAVAALPTLRWGPLKAALIALVVVLMGLNAIGAYGFLAKAHIASAVTGEVAVAAALPRLRRASQCRPVSWPISIGASP